LVSFKCEKVFCFNSCKVFFWCIAKRRLYLLHDLGTHRRAGANSIFSRHFFFSCKEVCRSCWTHFSPHRRLCDYFSPFFLHLSVCLCVCPSFYMCLCDCSSVYMWLCICYLLFICVCVSVCVEVKKARTQWLVHITLCGTWLVHITLRETWLVHITLRMCLEGKQSCTQWLVHVTLCGAWLVQITLCGTWPYYSMWDILVHITLRGTWLVLITLWKCS